MCIRDRAIETTGEVAGVRGGTDIIVKVDVRALIEAGAVCWWSANNVLLTAGLYDARGSCLGIPPDFIIEICDRASGRSVRAVSAPEIGDDRRPVAAATVVPALEVIVSAAEAETLKAGVAFLEEEKTADVSDLEKLIEEQELTAAAEWLEKDRADRANQQASSSSLQPTAAAGSEARSSTWTPAEST